MNAHITHDEAVLHACGEAGAAAPAIDAHLAACDQCRRAFADLREMLAAVESLPPEEPPPGFDARLWARIEPALRLSPWQRFRRWRPMLVPAGAMAAVVAAAFAAGWFARPAEMPSRPAVPATPVAGADDMARIRLLRTAVGDHLDRSGMVLAELVHGGRPDAGAQAVDRAVASDLVAAGRLYRQTAAEAGDDALERTLDDVERVLVEVANAPAESSPADLAALRAEIERRGLLFRVRVLSDDLRARDGRDAPEGPRPPAGKGPTS